MGQNSMPDTLQQVVKMYEQQPDMKKMGFLTSLFKVGPESFTDVDKISMDMVYGGNDMAPVVRDLGTGAVVVTIDKFGNMEVPFPVYSLETPVNISQLMNRLPGENAFLTSTTRGVNWMGRMARLIKDGTARHLRMIKNSMEYQAAQVLTTGKCTLTDEDGNSINELDYQIPGTHFPASKISWADPKANPIDDLNALDDVIRTAGLCDVTNYVMGKKAWNHFLKNEQVHTNLDKNILNTLEISPQMRDKGAAYLGKLNLDGRIRLFWGYDATYNPWNNRKETEYFLNPNKVIALPSYENMDFRRYFGGIPSIKVDPVFDPLFGNKITVEGEYDFKVRVWFDEEAETYKSRTRSRPLFVPASRLRFGCMTVIT
ncbi:MAG: major capsid protein [Treponema sp.]|nr:major capsid protein [Treponema sp.]